MERISKDNVGSLDLDAFVDAVRGIYSVKDKERSVWDVWLHAKHHAAAIGEEIRKHKPGEELLYEIADFSMWLFTFVGKIKGTFEIEPTRGKVAESTIRTEKESSDIIWNKYPRICPTCFWRRSNNSSVLEGAEFSRTCDCLLYDVETRNQETKRSRVRKLRKYANARENYEKKPRTVDLWQGMFGEIFKANLRHLGLVDIGFHLLEEVGEVSDAMVRMYTYTNDFKEGEPTWRQIWLEEEIADVFSWLFTLVNSLQMIPDIAEAYIKYISEDFKLPKHQIKLSRIIWRRYGSNDLGKFWCQLCQEPQCRCKIKLVLRSKDYKTLVKYADVDVLS